MGVAGLFFSTILYMLASHYSHSMFFVVFFFGIFVPFMSILLTPFRYVFIVYSFIEFIELNNNLLINRRDCFVMNFNTLFCATLSCFIFLFFYICVHFVICVCFQLWNSNVLSNLKFLNIFIKVPIIKNNSKTVKMSYYYFIVAAWSKYFWKGGQMIKSHIANNLFKLNREVGKMNRVGRVRIKIVRNHILTNKLHKTFSCTKLE